MNTKEARELILSKILKVDRSELKYLGSGNFAVAFLYKNKVYKVTDDLEDFILSQKVCKNPKDFPHFVKIYQTKRIVGSEMIKSRYFNGYDELYLIVSEFVEPIYNTEYRSLWNRLLQVTRTSRFVADGASNIRPFESLEKPAENVEVFKAMYDEVIKIMDWYKSKGLIRWDNHDENLGWVDGKIKIFDLGFNGSNDCRYSKRAKYVFKLDKKSDELKLNENPCLNFAHYWEEFLKWNEI